MSEYQENFRKWFVDILNDLMDNKPDAAGAILLMVSFPLLERYLQAKVGDSEKRQHERLAQLFPQLASAENAGKFWHAYRDNLLHQVTLQLGHAWRVSGDTDAVQLGPNGRFLVDPVKFTKRVLKIIEDDFDEFANGQPVAKHPHLGVQGTNTAATGGATPLQHQDRYG